MRNPEKHENPAIKSEVRTLLEKQLAGSLIAFSSGRKPYLPADVLAICPPEYFISPARHIMQAMKDAMGAGVRVDLVTVAEAMKRRANGAILPVHLADVSEWSLSFSNLLTERGVLEAAEAIAVEWRKEQAEIEIAEALRLIRTYGAPADMVRDSLRAAQDVLDSKPFAQDAGLDCRLDEYCANLDAERTAKPVQSPWESVTRILRGGVLPGELCILAARPSVGKSALALNWAWSVACSGKRTLFFSLEMGREQLLDRLVANVGGIDLGAFRQGLTPEQRRRVRKTTASMRGKKLDVIDDARMTLGEVRRRVRTAQRREIPVGLVVVDYLQLVTPEDSKAPREQQVAAMSRGFKLLAKDLGVPVLLLAQLSRKGEDANREPMLSDLRESGAIEQDADIVIFLHQARKRTWHPDEPVKFIVSKGRSSGVGRGNLVFRRRLQRFEESSEAAFDAAEKEEYAQENHWSDQGQAELF